MVHRNMIRQVGGLALLLCGGCLAHHRGALPGEPGDSSYAELGDTRVRYERSGQGTDDVVLLHGFGSSLDSWDEVVPALQPQHRVLALDLKGFGYTDRPEGDYSPRAQARLVFALMDKLGIRRAAVVAHSWGSSVALQMALSEPERVSRLVLVDAGAYQEQFPSLWDWARVDGLGELLIALFYGERWEDKAVLAWYDPSKLTQEHVDEIEEAVSRPGSKAAVLAAIRGMRYEEVQTHYPEVRQPTLIAWGREDRLTPLKWGERLVSELPNSTLRVYPRCGHFPMREALEPFLRDLTTFLAEDTADPAQAEAPSAAADAAPSRDAAALPEAVPGTDAGTLAPAPEAEGKP